MSRCEHFQALMLEQVYGLLEPEDGRELTQHLEGCEACRQALARAGQEQGVLATAAKREFPQVRFTEPASEPAAAVLPMTRGGGSPGWFRWAVAAAILLAIVGFGIPAGLSSQQRDRVGQAEARLEQTRDAGRKLDADYAKLKASRLQTQKEIDDMMKEIDDLQNQEQQAEQKVWQEANRQHFRMAISGPKAPLPGAPNAYTIETRALANNQPANADITVKVRDSKDNIVYEAKDLKSTGVLQVQLPRDIPLKANDELTLEVTAKTGDKVEVLADKLKLIAPVYLTHLTTDKPMYQPGETVRFRSLTLERFSLRPPPEDLYLTYTITKPNGQQVQVANGLSEVMNENGLRFIGPDKKPVRGLGAGEYVINEPVGGEYTLSVRDAANRFPEQKRKFLVNVYEKPRFNKKLEFAKRSYGAGEKVSVTATAKRAENEAVGVADQPVTAVLNIDGQQIAPVKGGLRTDKNGSVEVEFNALPKTIGRGDASVSITFTDGGSVEPIVRPVPIVLSKLEVEYFPEGGDLVAGVPNRVYFQTRTTLGKPAELKGRILDDANAVACDVQTFSDAKVPEANHGMGVFTFTPLEGKKYRLQVDVPAGITDLVGPKNAKDGQNLPAVKPDGIVLSVPSGVTSEKDAIHAVVRSAKGDRRVLVGAYCRGRLLAHQRIEAKAGKSVDVDLRPEGNDGGVIRVTAFEEHSVNGKTDLTPVAERLVYRAPGRKLNISVQAERQNYTPGERVKLVCMSVDEKGQKAPSIVMVAVVDKSVVTMADEKTFRQMPTHFLLTTEVRRPEDLEHADFLLSNNPNGPMALDLLLGTQGWRRFAEQNPGQFKQAHPQEADQVLVLNNNFVIDNNVVAQDKAWKVAETYNAKAEAKWGQVQEAQTKLVDMYRDDRLLRERSELEAEVKERKADYDKVVQSASAFATRFTEIKRVALPAFALALLIIGLFGVARAILQQSRQMMVPYLAGAGCCFALLAAMLAVPIGPKDDSFAQKMFRLDAPAWAGADDVVAQLDDNMRPEDAAVPEALMEREKAAADPAAAHLKRGEGKGEGKGDDKDEAGGKGRPAPKKPGLPFADKAAGKFDGKPAEEKRNNRLLMPPGKNGAPGQFGRMPMMPPPPMAVPRPALAGEPQAQAAKKAKEQLENADALNKFDGARRGAYRADRMINRKDLQMQQQRNQPRFGVGGAMPGRDMPAPGGFAGPGLRARQLERDQLAAAAVNPVPLVVREYAHHHERKDPKVRDDETETVYWHPVLVLQDGKAEVSFQLSTQVTTFQVLAAGHTLDGRLGSVTVPIESRLPLTLEPKLPTEVTQGDKIDVPVTIANNTGEARTVDVTVQPTGLALTSGKATESVTVGPDGRARKVWRLSPTLVEGEAKLTIAGSAKNVEGDSKETRFKVVPAGFPIVNAKSDLLERTALDAVELPKDVLPGTLKVQVAVYPSTLADLQKGLEAMLREPNGCFEQTSTTNYPNLLILNYLKESDQAKDKPQVVARAKDLLGRGYGKLTSFECMNVPDQKKKGYEWFGGTAPAHEALTAYGLMQFRDMAAVYDVDPIMVERTK
ncbi:hypothetical protein AYO40_02235, partial [Planctomycetaceae bacterium SCGC AG-212-D15]